MTPEIFSEWLRRQGQKVARTASSYWHSEGFGVYQAFPYHHVITPSDEELSEMFSRHRAVALRYSMPSNSEKGCPSYAIRFDGENYDLEMLGHRTRKNVRRGLRECVIEPITFQTLVDEGWPLRLDALERQGRHLNITRETWAERYLKAADLPGFNVWGARVGGQFAGYVITFQMEDCLCVIDHQSHRQYLDLNVNNALTYTVSKDAISQARARTLFYGLESLDAPESVSEFKFRMGYAAYPIRQRVVFNPRVAPLANRLSYRLVKVMSRLQPANRRYAKASGMLRVFLSEKHSQSLPSRQPSIVADKQSASS